MCCFPFFFFSEFLCVCHSLRTTSHPSHRTHSPCRRTPGLRPTKIWGTYIFHYNLLVHQTSPDAHCIFRATLFNPDKEPLQLHSRFCIQTSQPHAAYTPRPQQTFHANQIIVATQFTLYNIQFKITTCCQSWAPEDGQRIA